MPSVDIPTESACVSSATSANDGNSPIASQSGRAARLSRLLWTLRYHRPSQLLRRALAVAGRGLHAGSPVERFAIPAKAPITLEFTDGFRRSVSRKLEGRRGNPRNMERVDDIRDGRLTFLGRSIELGSPLAWRSPALQTAPRLWRFQLQYHEWLLDLAATADADDSRAALQAWDNVENWIASCGTGSERNLGDAWHPYCLSRRIPVWLTLWSWRAPPVGRQASIVRSLAAQTAFLARRLERDLGGNHLLENARALMLAGSTLQTPDAPDWFGLGRSIFESELDEQLLAHGEHFERSPMYHCQMMEVLEDARDATIDRDPEFSRTCADAAVQMREFSAAIVHPDGRIPLLGDACFDETPIQGLTTAPQSDSARRVGDYWIFRNAGDYLLFDAGPVGPDHLPAHAHADLLTIEASFDGVRFVVDSGVHDYEDGPMRQYCRSTAAHNVLEIDGENQCEVWSRFRMGRRGWPTELICGEAGAGHWASAAHNAYRRLGVHRVARWIRCDDEGGWLIVDAAFGRGSHELVNRLHLHPDVHVTRLSDVTVRLERAGVNRWVSAIGGGELSLVDGWYCPRFGERIVNRVIEVRLQPSLPAAVGWQFSADGPARAAQLSLTGDGVSIAESVTGVTHVFPRP